MKSEEIRERGLTLGIRSLFTLDVNFKRLQKTALKNIQRKANFGSSSIEPRKCANSSETSF